MIEALAPRGEDFDHGERGQGSEVAIIAAGVLHRVDVRADHHRRLVGRLALIARTDVAGRIEHGLEPRLARPFGETVAGLSVGRRKIEPRQLAGLVAESGEVVEARHQAARGAGDVGHVSSS